jgi:hypothetical protein
MRRPERLQRDVTGRQRAPKGMMIFCYGLAQMAIVRGHAAVYDTSMQFIF